MIRVLSAHAGSDTAGIGWGLSRAFRDHPSVELRSAVKQSNYIDYPQDLPWQEAEHRIDAVDVLHLHNTFRTADLLTRQLKPMVIHHHGTHYRLNAESLNLQVRNLGAVAVCATLDLLDYGDVTWVPHPYDLAALPKRKQRKGTKLRVGHAPTDRTVKSTDAFLAACAKIPDVEPVVIEGRTWVDCLNVKATVDVYYDQVALGYGCNAIEAWGMGIPVIVGAADATLSRMVATFGCLPFYVADETTIGDAVKALLDDDARALAAARGAAHVRRWHDGTETVNRLTPIYEALA